MRFALVLIILYFYILSSESIRFGMDGESLDIISKTADSKFQSSQYIKHQLHNKSCNDLSVFEEYELVSKSVGHVVKKMFVISGRVSKICDTAASTLDEHGFLQRAVNVYYQQTSNLFSDRVTQSKLYSRWEKNTTDVGYGAYVNVPDYVSEYTFKRQLNLPDHYNQVFMVLYQPESIKWNIESLSFTPVRFKNSYYFLLIIGIAAILFWVTMFSRYIGLLKQQVSLVQGLIFFGLLSAFIFIVTLSVVDIEMSTFGLYLVYINSKISSMFSWSAGRIGVFELIHVAFFVMTSYLVLTVSCEFCKAIKIVLTLFLFGLLIEVLQLHVASRSTSELDLVLNCVGILIGWLGFSIRSNLATRCNDRF